MVRCGSLQPSSYGFSAGGHREVAIPVPIPNTEVKGLFAEGSAGRARARVGRRRLFSFLPPRGRPCGRPSFFCGAPRRWTTHHGGSRDSATCGASRRGRPASKSVNHRRRRGGAVLRCDANGGAADQAARQRPCRCRQRIDSYTFFIFLVRLFFCVPIFPAIMV